MNFDFLSFLMDPVFVVPWYGFGLLAGAIFTYPMNWWLVSIGWKHGMA